MAESYSTVYLQNVHDELVEKFNRLDDNEHGQSHGRALRRLINEAWESYQTSKSLDSEKSHLRTS